LFELYKLKLPAIMKTLYCRDAGFDCPGVIQANTEEEVLKNAVQHAQEVHGVSVTPQLEEQLRALIREENPKES
jgi:predicted small metal-binding protein